MLNTPGSKVLTEYLTRVIRLQRHLGARVVISTQEPTVSTDLIALCSVTVIHRFTSPAWYNALKKHINAMDDDDKIMHDIEGLETGEAIVYAPNAVLDRNEDGTLVKATGCLLRLNIRDRVTLDGGESIMAV
jgi:DNA helicase HerA-like ATPase